MGRIRRRGRVPDGLPDRSPDAARNATGATFAWGPFRPLDFSGPRTPPEFGPPPEDHSQLVCGYRLLMRRRYSSRITSAGPLRNLHLGAILVWANFVSDHRTDDRSDRTASQLLSQREAARRVPNCAQPIILAYGTCASFSRLPIMMRPTQAGRLPASAAVTVRQ